jgi:triphosphatase
MELQKLPYLDLSNVASLEEAACLIFRENLQHLQNNVQLFLAENNGRSLMQVRIATRRVRMAMTTFQPFLNSDTRKTIEREFKHFGRKMGSARDLDVLLFGIVGPQNPLPEFDEEYAQLRQRIEQARDLQFAKVRRRLQSKRFQGLLSDYEKWLEHPFVKTQSNTALTVKTFAFQAIAGARDQLLTRSQKLDWADIKSLHKFRKYVKQYRYNIRFFASLLEPSVVEDAYAAIVPLQDFLGEVNDIYVGAEIVREFVTVTTSSEPLMTNSMGECLLRSFAEQLSKKIELSKSSLPKIAEFEVAQNKFR